MAAAKTLAEALLTVQKKAPKLEKDSKNPHFGNTYASLEAIVEAVLPLLNANDILLVQAPTSITLVAEVIPALRTTLTHVPSGEKEEAIAPLVLDKQTPQGQGSGITYMRRYALVSMLGLIADEDDDGNAASRSKSKEPSEAEMKRSVWAAAKEKLGEDKPTAAAVAKVFGVKTGELADKETLKKILEDEKLL